MLLVWPSICGDPAGKERPGRRDGGPEPACHTAVEVAGGGEARNLDPEAGRHCAVNWEGVPAGWLPCGRGSFLRNQGTA